MSSDNASRPAAQNGDADRGRGALRGSRVWWWVVVAFALQFAAWTAWLIIAAHQKVQEVPLATESAGAD